MSAPLFFLNSDAKILDRIRSGDEKALVTLYEANRTMITSYVTRNNGSHDDAEDMLQEAVVVLWERVRSGSFERQAKLSTFLYATVKNIWSRRLARQRREVRTDIDPDRSGSDDASALDDMIEDEQSRKIAEAMAQLGEQCRKLLVLFYWEELSTQEIALKLGFANADTVKSKKYQCKKSLETILRRTERI